MLGSNFSYGMSSRGNQHNQTSIMFMEACYAAGAKDLAKKVSEQVRTDLRQQIVFYESLEGLKADNMERDLQNARALLQELEARQKRYETAQTAPPNEGGPVMGDSPAQRK